MKVTVSCPCGMQNNHTPLINSNKPNANPQPLPGYRPAFTREKTKLKQPATHIAATKKYANTGKVETGSHKHQIPTVIAKRPVINGIHHKRVKPPLKM